MHDSALIVIDVQNDFCPNGRLAVAGGDLIIPAINAMMNDHKVVLLTQDWHPADHSSFAANHPGKQPFDMIDVSYGPQVLWPVHCVQGSEGAAFHAALNTNRADLIIRKGFRREIDSYSAFYENDHKTPTGLEGYLKTRKIKDLVLVGLATDYCVAYSAIDAAALGFRVTVVEKACRAINMNGSLEDARKKMKAAGVGLN